MDELLEGTRSEQILAARAQLAELEAAQEQLQVQLDESVLASSLRCYCSDRFIEPGTVTAPGANAFRLVETELPEVWIGIPPEFLSSIQDQRSVELHVGDRPLERV